MSDGITDSYRDQERSRRFEDFIKSILAFLKDRSEINLKDLQNAASAVDYIPRGLMSGKTNISEGLPKLLEGLQQNDKRIWGELLARIADGYSLRKEFDELKNMSPFKGKCLLLVDYGIGFASLRGEFKSAVDNLISKENNLRIYDTDKYLVAIPLGLLGASEVTWLNCGIYGIKEPRPNKKW